MNLLMNNVALALNNWFQFSVQDSDLAHFGGPPHRNFWQKVNFTQSYVDLHDNLLKVRFEYLF